MHKTWKISVDALLRFSFVFYLCFDLANAFFRKLLGIIGIGSLSSFICYLCIYIPVLICCLCIRKRRVVDSLALYFFLLLFFGITILIHPEYEYFYEREYWGVWDYVFRPENGIHIFLFIRLIDDPKKLLKSLRFASFIMIAYYAYRLIPFLRNGYWVRYHTDGSSYFSTYNLEYGYDVLLFGLVELYYALKKKKVIDWLFAIIAIVSIMLGGSRGPFLCYTVFLVFYFWEYSEQSKRKPIIITSFLLAGLLLFFSYKYLLAGVAQIIQSLGLSSRIIKSLVMGTASDDNGRLIFWKKTIEMIKENPFGYGAMGTRPVLYVYHEAGYPHNFFLELIADLGVFIGGGLSLYFLFRFYRILKMKDLGEWKDVLLIFTGMFSNLMISSTFYHRIGFWGLFAVCLCIRHARRASRDEGSGRRIIEV